MYHTYMLPLLSKLTHPNNKQPAHNNWMTLYPCNNNAKQKLGMHDLLYGIIKTCYVKHRDDTSKGCGNMYNTLELQLLSLRASLLA